MEKAKTQGYDDCLQSYFDQIKKIPLLTFEEELKLSRRIQNGDKTARSRLIEANLRLVVKIARAYLTCDVSLMDLIQEGNVGLMHAADRYDYLKQVRFCTYAVWWIRQSIIRHLFEKRRTIRLPHRKEETLCRVQQAYYSLSQMYMRQPNIKEIAAEIGVSQEDVEFILGLARDIVSFDAGKGDNESRNVMEFLEDYTYNPERALLKENSRETTLKVLNQLKDREKRILIYRYQLNGGKPYTLKNIGVKLGLSPETVRQIELRALRKLRGHAEELRPYIEAI